MQLSYDFGWAAPGDRYKVADEIIGSDWLAWHDKSVRLAAFKEFSTAMSDSIKSINDME